MGIAGIYCQFLINPDRVIHLTTFKNQQHCYGCRKSGEYLVEELMHVAEILNVGPLESLLVQRRPVQEGLVAPDLDQYAHRGVC